MNEAWLFAKNKENAVYNFQSELIQLAETKRRPKKGLNEHQVKTLIKLGLIYKVEKHGGQGCFRLTDYTLRVLADLQEPRT